MNNYLYLMKEYLVFVLYDEQFLSKNDPNWCTKRPRYLVDQKEEMSKQVN